MTEVISNVEPTTEHNEDSIDVLFEKLEQLNMLTKWVNSKGRALIKKHTKTRRKRNNTTSEKKSGFAVPVKASNNLANFLNLDTNELIPRTEVTKRITAYIKENNLQCQENKKMFTCNDKLASIFEVEPGTVTNWFQMQKFLSKQLTSVREDKPETSTAPLPTPPPTAPPPTAPPPTAPTAPPPTAPPPTADTKKKIKRTPVFND